MCYAQERNRLHWGVDDGLASSTVYCAIQDRQGFMWFGTDQGLCRFDGTNFKTYTVSEGLTDNDVLWLSEDIKGRIWIICFNVAVCYIENGVLHKFLPVTPDQVQKTLDFPRKIISKPNGNIVLALSNAIYELDSSLKVVDLYPIVPSSVKDIVYTSEGLLMAENTNIVSLKGKTKTIIYRAPAEEGTRMHLHVIREKVYFNLTAYGGSKLMSVDLKDGGNPKVIYTTDKLIQCMKVMDDRNITVALINKGLANINVEDSQQNKFFFIDNKVSSVCVDRDSNLWITTIGEGVFMLPKKGVTFYDKRSGLFDNNVVSICGDSSGALFLGYRGPSLDILDLKNNIQHIPLLSRYGGIFPCLIKPMFGNIYVGSMDFGCKISSDGSMKIFSSQEYMALKNFSILETGEWLVAGPLNSYKFTPPNYIERKLIFDQRSTAVAEISSDIYAIGTLSGLYITDHGKTFKYDKDSALSESRIFEMVRDAKHRLWISTYQNGIYVMVNNSVSRVNGLLSNLCKMIYADEKDNLWVCTTKGLNKIEADDKGNFNIKKFDMTDGMPTNEISSVYAYKGTVWVATSQGLVKFREQDLVESAGVRPPPVYVLSFWARDSVYSFDHPIYLSYRDNDIRVDYAGVTFTSGKGILYKYLLKGSSDRDTVFTTATSIRFGSLGPAHYHLYIWAATRGKVWSAVPAEVTFEITPPFWQRLWFYILAASLLFLSIWLVVRYRISIIKKRENERVEVNKRFSELELQALRAQMNPHFIFNALNSIQSFYAANDELTANRYMMAFSSLIRQILHSSSQSLTTLQNEVQLLSDYISLEKMRLKDKFEYTIAVSPNIDPQKVTLPIMLIQPYVENAINHGLKFMEAHKGFLKVYFEQENNILYCTIEDNGIGLKASQKRKEERKSKHISEGMKITRQRVDTLNTLYNNSIEINIIDKSDIETNTTGVKVVIRIPIISQTSQKT
jgi:ligand-binding sensor domain-containing protein/signal transduction histidine kinase